MATKGFEASWNASRVLFLTGGIHCSDRRPMPHVFVALSSQFTNSLAPQFNLHAFVQECDQFCMQVTSEYELPVKTITPECKNMNVNQFPG